MKVLVPFVSSAKPSQILHSKSDHFCLPLGVIYHP